MSRAVTAPRHEPSHYAFRVLPGCLGTERGLRGDGCSRMLPIAGGEPVAVLLPAGEEPS